MFEEFDCFEPSQALGATFAGFLWRGVRQGEAEQGKENRGDASHDVGPSGEALGRFAGEGICENGADPFLESNLAERSHFIPIDEDEDEGPGGEDPTDGTAHADDPEFLLCILHISEGDGIGDRDGGDVEEAVEEHQTVERPKALGESATENGESANDVAEGEESLGGEISIGKLIAEEHSDD